MLSLIEWRLAGRRVRGRVGRRAIAKGRR